MLKPLAILMCSLTALAILFAPLASAALDDEVRALQREWEEIKYRKPAADQEKAFETLTKSATTVRAKYADRAEADIWYGIIVSSYAGAKGGIGALSLVKEAKAALEHALAIDPKALAGSAYTSLGSLYYQVPGWPIGFGDDKKAREMLETALKLNPDGIDPNYFYGDFLMRKKRYREARAALEKALAAADRPARVSADAGRREEARQLLKAVQAKLD